METIVKNKVKKDKNIPKLKYKLNSSEAIAFYVAIHIIIFIVIEIIDRMPGYWEAHWWCRAVIPYISIIIFTILFSTKFVITELSDLFKKYVIYAETVAIIRMKIGSYSWLIKDSAVRYTDKR